MRAKEARSEVALLLEIYDQAYEGRSWHGTNLSGSIRNLSPKAAGWRPDSARHNIYELVIHAAYWKYAAWRRLQGAKRGSFPLKGSNWIASPAEIREADWKQVRALLDRFHRQLRAAVASLTDAQLGRCPAGSRHSCATLIYGIASHDLYHAGQIQLLKRLCPR